MAIDYIETHLYKEPDRERSGEKMTNKTMLERNELHIHFVGALFKKILVLVFISTPNVPSHIIFFKLFFTLHQDGEGGVWEDNSHYTQSPQTTSPSSAFPHSLTSLYIPKSKNTPAA